MNWCLCKHSAQILSVFTLSGSLISSESTSQSLFLDLAWQHLSKFGLAGHNFDCFELSMYFQSPQLGLEYTAMQLVPATLLKKSLQSYLQALDYTNNFDIESDVACLVTNTIPQRGLIHACSELMGWPSPAHSYFEIHACTAYYWNRSGCHYLPATHLPWFSIVKSVLLQVATH